MQNNFRRGNLRNFSGEGPRNVQKCNKKNFGHQTHSTVNKSGVHRTDRRFHGNFSHKEWDEKKAFMRTPKSKMSHYHTVMLSYLVKLVEK